MTTSDNTGNWLLDAVRFFRNMGFFGEHQHLSDEELANHLDAICQENAEHSLNEYAAKIAVQVEADAKRAAAGEKEDWDFDMPPAMADVVLAFFDKSRIWWDDGETDIWPEGKIYIKAIHEWSHISRGAFLPQDVKEVWESKDGPTWIELMLNGGRHRLTPQQHFGWLDFGVLGQVNELIRESGFQFYVVDKEFDQKTCLIVLTEDEKVKLEQERKWGFEEPVGFD